MRAPRPPHLIRIPIYTHKTLLRIGPVTSRHYAPIMLKVRIHKKAKPIKYVLQSVHILLKSNVMFPRLSQQDIATAAAHTHLYKRYGRRISGLFWNTQVKTIRIPVECR